MWPFRESRAGDATQAAVARAVALAAGTVPQPELLAAVEACCGLWERSLASATVAPDSLALRNVSPDLLALAGRGLAIRGGFVAAIRVAPDEPARLIPASAWDVQHGSADPRTWRYRVDLIGPSGSVTQNLSADEVLHVRIGGDPKSPWHGRGPLQRAERTGELAARLEASLIAESKLPTGRIAPYSGVPAQLQNYGRLLADVGGLTVVQATAGIAPMGGQEPSSRLKPVGFGPEPDETLTALRTAVGHDIAAAFGVPPALFEPRGDGSGTREAWRRFWAGTVQPIGRLVEAELRAKLDPSATVTFEALRASDEDGRSRAVARRATAYRTFRDAGLADAEAKRLAGLT